MRIQVLLYIFLFFVPFPSFILFHTLEEKIVGNSRLSIVSGLSLIEQTMYVTRLAICDSMPSKKTNKLFIIINFGEGKMVWNEPGWWMGLFACFVFILRFYLQFYFFFTRVFMQKLFYFLLLTNIYRTIYVPISCIIRDCFW